MTNEQRQKSLDKSKWLESERTGWDWSGVELYCDFCERQAVGGTVNFPICTATQAERESKCLCAKAYNRMHRGRK